MGMKIVVDYDRCEANAICMQVCPEVFEVKDDDCLYLSTETPSEDLRATVEDAVRRCPRQAIVLEEG
jgi:ferredoxin